MVLPVRIEGATRVLAESQNEYLCLAIRDELVADCPTMVSAWELTPREIELISLGAKIYVYIMGEVHPPMMVKVK